MAIVVILGLASVLWGVALSREWVAEGKNVLMAMLMGFGMVGIPVALGVLALTTEIDKPGTLRGRVAATVAVTALAVGGTWAWALGSSVNRPEERILAAMAPVCRGETVASAAPYPADISPAHVVLLRTDGDPHAWAGKLPFEWKPTAIGDTHLVACAQREVQLQEIEVCQYEGTDITRYRSTLDVRLIAAHTGELIWQGHLEKEPRECMERERSSTTELKGALEAPALVSALRPYVEGAKA
jgi:hypothetical protein